MTENVNFLLPKVGHFGKDKSASVKHDEESSSKPKKKGQISKSTRFKKHKTLNRFDNASDHNAKTGISPKKENLSIGLPHVTSRSSAAGQTQESDLQCKANQVSFPQILLKHTNIWGKRDKFKKEKVDLKVEGSDLPLPPPKPLTIPRNRQSELVEVKDEDGEVSYFSDEEVDGEVADIRKILHCHIVGIPVEVRRVKDNETQIARPIFHCQKCLDHWLETSIIKEDCTEKENHVRGPKMQISDETAKLIKTVWSQQKGKVNGKARMKKRHHNPLKTTTTASKHKFKHDVPKTQRTAGMKVDGHDGDNMVHDMVHPDDYSVVLEHIAEGIARNAGFEENIINNASYEVAENLNNILSGQKPDDPAMMELIEKHLGETELMILRAMVDSEKGSILAVDSDHSESPYGKNNIGEERISNQIENANRLLDRLAVLKSREVKDVHADKVEYLTEVFKGKDGKGKISDRYVDVTIPKDQGYDHETDSEVLDSTIDDLLERDDGYVMTEGIMTQHKRAVGGKYGRQKIAKVGHLERKQPRNIEDMVNPIDHTELEGVKINTVPVADDEDESYMDDYSSFHSYSSMGSTDDRSEATSGTTTGISGRTPRSDETDKSTDTKTTVHIRKKYKNKIGPFSQERRSRRSIHKVHKKGKHTPVHHVKPNIQYQEHTKDMPQQSPMYVSFGSEKYNRLVDARDSKHIVYDVDDLDDYDSSDEEGAFVIPGNDDYTDSAYDNLVDELVQHFENKSSKEGKEKVDTSKFKEAIQRKAIQKTKLRKVISKDFTDENKTARFRAGSTVNVGKMQCLEERQRQDGHEEDQSYNENNVLDNNLDELTESSKQQTHKEKFDRNSNLTNYDKYSRDIGAKRNALLDQGNMQSENGGNDINSTYNTSQRLDNDLSQQNVQLSQLNFNGVEQQQRKKSVLGSNSTRRSSRFVHNSPDMSGENLIVNTTDSEQLNQLTTRRGSIMSGSTVTKHVAVGETHFGMQLDALGNLPSVPNQMEMKTRRRSIAQPSRPKVPKSAVQAHHSRQIEDSGFDASKARPSEIQQPDNERIKAQPSEFEKRKSVMSTTQIEKSKPAKKKPHSISLVKKEGPVRTLIGQDQAIFSTPGSKVPPQPSASRPSSSKKPLPPIHHLQTPDQSHVEEIHPADILQPFQITGQVHDKPVATVKPIMAASSKEKLTKTASHGSLTSTESKADVPEEYTSSHIIIPPSEAISILSFTSSFSFSMFSLPNQYRQRNETVKNYVNQVGKTQAKETSQTIINKIPTKDKRKGTKNYVVLKNKQVVNNLNKKVQNKVNDPKPIARYVKKILAPVREEDAGPVSKQYSAHLKETSEESNKDLKSSKIDINIVDENGQNTNIITVTSQHKDNHDTENLTKNGLVQNMSVYASLPMESQMHLNQQTESIIIRVQDYS